MYDISISIVSKTHKLEKRTEIIKIQLSQTSKDTQGPLFPMLFPILGAHMSVVELPYSDLTWKDFSGQMAHIETESRDNKADNEDQPDEA